MFYTYIIYSQSKDKYYTGHTSATPQERLDRHNNGMTVSTKSGIPWTLVFFKSFDNKTDSIKFENHIKRQTRRLYLLKN
ncbi:GIY-YIG nuclease family protein [Rhodohalobacter sp.]|uniref:GIY-YIG nuclease family protein n=1 Tax=Rhodohalobacter sp. TaxID=1974210 RepID=UPI003A0FCFB9